MTGLQKAPGPTTPRHPKWRPGDRGPTGPVGDRAGMCFHAGDVEHPRLSRAAGDDLLGAILARKAGSAYNKTATTGKR